MRLKIFLATLGCILCLHAHAQSVDIASLETQLKDAETDSARFDICIDLHNAHFKTEPQKSLAYAEQMLALGNEVGDWRRQAKAYQAMARCYTKLHNYAAVIPLDKKVLELAETNGGSEDLIFAANRKLANDYMDAEQYSKARPYLEKLSRLAEAGANPVRQAEAAQSLGYLYRELAQHRRAIPYFQKAVPLFASAGKEGDMSDAMVFMSQSLVEVGRTDSVAAYIGQAMEICQRRNSLARLGFCKEVLGNLQEKLGDRKRALKLYAEARTLYQAHRNFTQHAYIGLDLARMALPSNDTTAARRYLEEATSVFQTSGYIPGIIASKLQWGDYYSQTGNPQKADKTFTEAARLIHLPDGAAQHIELKRLQVAHHARYKDERATDSLIYEHAAAMVARYEPEKIAEMLAAFRAGNKELSREALAAADSLFAHGGAARLKKRMDGRSISKILPLDKLLAIGTNAAGGLAKDSVGKVVLKSQLVAEDAVFNEDRIRDSLQATQKEHHMVERKLHTWIAAVLVACLVLLSIFLLANSSRRKAERNAAKLRETNDLLEETNRRLAVSEASVKRAYGQMNHLVENNIAGIKEFILQIASAAASGSGVDMAALNNKITAFERLHHLLYKSAEAGMVPMQDFLTDICINARIVYGQEGSAALSISAPYHLPANEGMKVGIIISELVTNSFKYAIPAAGDGQIGIEILRAGPQRYTLHYYDNGPGKPKGAASGEGTDNILVIARSLGGKPDFHSAGGLHFKTEFFLSQEANHLHA